MVKKITLWDNELPESILLTQKKLKERRTFLIQLSSISVTAIVPRITLATTNKKKTEPLLNQQPWITFAAVQEHLFPATKDSPGASDINATLYLKNTLDNPDMLEQDRKFILKGITWLNNISNKLKNKPFINLSKADKELVLRKITNSTAGENWLSTLLLYIIEALLTPPVYGGNPNGIGWKWLEYQPGFPLPTKDKKYFKL